MAWDYPNNSEAFHSLSCALLSSRGDSFKILAKNPKVIIKIHISDFISPVPVLNNSIWNWRSDGCKTISEYQIICGVSSPAQDGSGIKQWVTHRRRNQMHDMQNTNSIRVTVLALRKILHLSGGLTVQRPWRKQQTKPVPSLWENIIHSFITIQRKCVYRANEVIQLTIVASKLISISNPRFGKTERCDGLLRKR